MRQYIVQTTITFAQTNEITNTAKTLLLEQNEDVLLEDCAEEFECIPTNTRIVYAENEQDLIQKVCRY
jgi:hypothetical protein